ncbi:hypothetical protein HK096_005480, partial [Nowakowskiella sp. JEL0078]
ISSRKHVLSFRVQTHSLTHLIIPFCKGFQFFLDQMFSVNTFSNPFHIDAASTPFQVDANCKELLLFKATLITQTDGFVEQKKQVISNTTEGGYVAISHVWGHVQTPIRRDGVNDNVCIDQDKLNDLVVLSEQFPSCWMDVICINQESQEDKSYHLRVMWSIYHQAMKVVILLSQEDKIRFQSLGYSADSDAYDIALFLSTTTWMDRVWTLQEVVAARELYLCVNNHDVSQQVNSIFEAGVIDEFITRTLGDDVSMRAIDKWRRIIRTRAFPVFGDICDEISTRNCKFIHDRLHAAKLIHSHFTDLDYKTMPDKLLWQYLYQLGDKSERWIDYCGLGISPPSQCSWMDTAVLCNTKYGNWFSRSQRRLCQGILSNWTITEFGHLKGVTCMISVNLTSWVSVTVQGCRLWADDHVKCRHVGSLLLHGWSQRDLCLLLNHVTAISAGNCSIHPAVTVNIINAFLDEQRSMILVLDEPDVMNTLALDLITLVQVIGSRFLVCTGDKNRMHKVGMALLQQVPSNCFKDMVCIE